MQKYRARFVGRVAVAIAMISTGLLGASGTAHADAAELAFQTFAVGESEAIITGGPVYLVSNDPSTPCGPGSQAAAHLSGPLTITISGRRAADSAHVWLGDRAGYSDQVSGSATTSTFHVPMDGAGLNGGFHCADSANGTSMKADVYLAYNASDNGVESFADYLLGDPPSTTVPAAPTGVTIRQSGTNVSVAFSPGSDGGSAVTSYTADCAASDAGASGTGATSPITVAGLVPGDTYTCVVWATNGVGDGPYSDPADFTPAATPAAPTNVNATPSGTTASVGFTPGPDGGSAVTGYRAICSATDAPQAAGTGATSPVAVADLVPGKTYTCAVKATNGVGDGPYSGASAPFTVAVPGPHFTVTPNTDLIDGQTVRMHIDGAQPDAEAVLYQCTDAGAVNCDFSGSGFVDSSGQIDFDVEVHSSINGQRCGSACMEFAVTGSGNRTQSLSFRPTTTPAAPTGVNVTPSATSASVAFTPGADGGSAVTSYYARCTSSTGGLTRAMNGPASPLMVTGLTRGSTYTCKARATNATGTGAYSASTGPFVVRDVPLAPAIDGVTPSGTQVEVAFTPGPGGTPATSYTVLCAASGGTARSTSGPASPLVVRALSGGSNYSCQVRGANDMGKGPYSGPSTSFTPGTTVPGKPTSPAQTYSDRVATVTFTPEPDGGSPITSYTAVCTSTTGGASRSRTGAASPLSVQQLTTDQIYRCRVRAANAVGTGQYSPYTALFHT